MTRDELIDRLSEETVRLDLMGEEGRADGERGLTSLAAQYVRSSLLEALRHVRPNQRVREPELSLADSVLVRLSAEDVNTLFSEAVTVRREVVQLLLKREYESTGIEQLGRDLQA